MDDLRHSEYCGNLGDTTDQPIATPMPTPDDPDKIYDPMPTPAPSPDDPDKIYDPMPTPAPSPDDPDKIYDDISPPDDDEPYTPDY